MFRCRPDASSGHRIVETESSLCWSRGNGPRTYAVLPRLWTDTEFDVPLRRIEVDDSPEACGRQISQRRDRCSPGANAEHQLQRFMI